MSRALPGLQLADDCFECAICERITSKRWNTRGARAATNQLEPICLSCEQRYAAGIGMPRHGAFRDRREVRRGFALAEALLSQAGSIQWRMDNPNWKPPPPPADAVIIEPIVIRRKDNHVIA